MATEPQQKNTARRPIWLRAGTSLSGKLVLVLLATLAPTFLALAFFNVRLHRENLQSESQRAVQRMNDVLERSTSYYMMKNDREGLAHIINTVGAEPGIERIRIFNHEGRVSFSSVPSEVGQRLNPEVEDCAQCHTRDGVAMDPKQRTCVRVVERDGRRLVDVINPIENAPGCSNAACHAHPADQKVLGVLEANLSLAEADAAVASSTRKMLAMTIAAGVLVSLACGWFVLVILGRPLKELRKGTDRIARGELGCQIALRSQDEVGDLAASFNNMSRELADSRAQADGFAQQLESRVEQKTRELRAAHEQMLTQERLASIGKLAAVVAHEINNPLSGILTYAKLVRKWTTASQAQDPRAQDVRESLELIESETRRCGDIVKNMLTFARATPMNLARCELNAIVDRVVRLVQHKLELAGIELQREIDLDLPKVQCDGAQIEQLLLALVMNAIEAMPRGGVLTLRTGLDREAGEVRLHVQDDGMGIPAEILPRIFEPFNTTKEKSGVGLGLAVSRQIVDRHRGRIDVKSAPGVGTTMTISLPLGTETEAAAEALAGTAR